MVPYTNSLKHAAACHSEPKLSWGPLVPGGWRGGCYSCPCQGVELESHSQNPNTFGRERTQPFVTGFLWLLGLPYIEWAFRLVQDLGPSVAFTVVAASFVFGR